MINIEKLRILFIVLYTPILLSSDYSNNDMFLISTKALIERKPMQITQYKE